MSRKNSQGFLHVISQFGANIANMTKVIQENDAEKKKKQHFQVCWRAIP